MKTKQDIPEGWKKEDIVSMLSSYCETETVRIADSIGGYYARSLGDALAIDADLRRLKEAAGLSVSGLIDSLIESKKTINAGDVRDILSVGRSVRVGKSLGFDLVAGQVSLSSARYIGSRLPKLEEAKDSKAIKALFKASLAGRDVSKILPKTERKAKTDTEEDKTGGENKTESSVETRPATADELATALMARLPEVSEPVRIALLKALSASIKASKATIKASEPEVVANIA